MMNPIEKPADTNYEDTASLAYQLWKEEGSPTGRDLEFWLKAEAQLRQRQNHNAKPTPVAIPTGASCVTTDDGSMPPITASRQKPVSSKPGKKASRR